MKLICIILLFSSISWICGQQPNYSATTDPTGMSIARDTIPFDNLVLAEGDSIINAFYHDQDKLYSGWAIQYEEANDGTWRYIYHFENGIVQRLDVFGVKGYQHRFVEMKDGHPYHCVMFYRNGNKYLEEYYDKNKNPIGISKRWYETGELEWEKNYN